MTRIGGGDTPCGDRYRAGDENEDAHGNRYLDTGSIRKKHPHTLLKPLGL